MFAPQIAVNLPVSDFEASKAFYAALGWENMPDYTDHHAAAYQVSDAVLLMLLTDDYFDSFHPGETVPSKGPREVLNALILPERADVDAFIDKARAAGADVYTEPAENDGMYGAAFADPDGHAWEVMGG